MVYAPDDERVLSYSASKPSAAPVAAPPAAAPSSPSEQPSAPWYEDALLRLRVTYADARPWAEFYSTRNLSLPPFSSLSDRVSANLHVYRANYLIIAAFWLCVVVLGAIPQFLILAAVVFGGVRWGARLQQKGGVKPRHYFVGALVVLITVWLTNVGNSIVLALGLSAVAVGVHAALHVPQEIETEIATV